MKCNACGNETAAEAVYCPSCGERLDGQDAGTNAATPIQKFASAVKSRQSDGHEDEEELWRGGYSAKAMYGTWLVTGLVSLALIVAMFFFPAFVLFLAIAIVVMWALLGFLLLYRKLSVHYTLTTQRFIHRSGILKIVTDRVEVIDIDDVAFEQGIIQKLLNVGTIRLSSTDRSHPELVLAGISDVQNVADQIDDVRRGERRRRGLHIESI